jgi:hypothetical protein
MCEPSVAYLELGGDSTMSASLHPTPIPWSDFPAECLCYLVPMSILHLAIFSFGCFMLITLALLGNRRDTLKRRIGHLGVFIALFLLVGSCFNGLWSCLVYGRFYTSADYVFGFIPFWPLTKYWVEMYDDRGQLMSVPFQMQVIWFLFAAGTWSVTLILYRLVCRRSPPNQSPEPTAVGSGRSVPPGGTVHVTSRRWLSFYR